MENQENNKDKQKNREINELAKSLSNAQSEISNAHKDKKNPFFKSTYADLASVWDAIREPMTKNGLSIVQMPTEGVSGVIGLSSILMHESGQYIESKYYMKPVKDDPQGRGSCITYMRRYALQAILGVCPADDDGNAASHNQSKANKNMTPEFKETVSQGPSDAQLKRLFAIKSQYGWNDNQVKSHMLANYNKNSSKDLNYKEYDAICKYIEANPGGPK